MFSLSADGQLQLEVRGREPGTKLVFFLGDPQKHPTLVRDECAIRPPQNTCPVVSSLFFK